MEDGKKMNKFFFLLMLFGIGSVAGLGVLAPEFDLIAQKMGIFHTEDVGLDGCTCLDQSGAIVACDSIVTSDPLCPTTTPPP